MNPFKFGFYVTTDTHTAIQTTREDNYFGKYQHTEHSPNRHNVDVIPADDPALRIVTAQEGAARLTAVWGRENTRKEAYATTGSRIRVRIFGGWDFTVADLDAPDFVSGGYTRVVPMGGELHNALDAESGTVTLFPQGHCPQLPQNPARCQNS